MKTSTILFVFLAAHCCNAEPLPNDRRSCDTRRFRTPTKRTIRSELIRLQYSNTRESEVVKEIVHEECKRSVNAEIPRARRSVRSFVEAVKRGGQLAVKFGKKAGNYGRKYGRKAVRFGVEMGVETVKAAPWAEIAVDMVGTGVASAPEIINAFKSEEENLSFEEEKKILNKWEKELEAFRRNVRALLRNDTLEGALLRLPAVRQELGKELSILKSMPASDVKCQKDFIGRYHLEFRVETPELETLEARKCADIGEVNDDGTYEFYKFPESYIVERDGDVLSLDGSACMAVSEDSEEEKEGSGYEEVLPLCPVTALQEEYCSVESVEMCKTAKYEVDNEMSRKLPKGVVLFGRREMSPLNQKDLDLVKKPFFLEYEPS